jgi:hypothetical protein
MIRFLAILFFSLLLEPSMAQQLTLDSAIVIAMRNSPGLMIAKNNVNIAGLSNSYEMAESITLISGTSNTTQQTTKLE